MHLIGFGSTILVVTTSPDAALVGRIAASTGLSIAEAARVVEDVVAFHAEPVEDVVRRRHAQLKAHGARNQSPRIVTSGKGSSRAARIVARPRRFAMQLSAWSTAK